MVNYTCRPNLKSIILTIDSLFSNVINRINYYLKSTKHIEQLIRLNNPLKINLKFILFHWNVHTETLYVQLFAVEVKLLLPLIQIVWAKNANQILVIFRLTSRRAERTLRTIQKAKLLPNTNTELHQFILQNVFYTYLWEYKR